MAVATKKTTRKPAAKKTAKKVSPRKAAPRASKARGEDSVTAAARKAAEFLGMDPNEVQSAADKLRNQTKHAGARIKDEVGRLGQRADEVASKFDVQMKQGVKKVEKVADEVAKGLGLKPDDFADKLEKGLDRWGREAQKVAEEANVEIKKMYDQARTRLKDILNKK